MEQDKKTVPYIVLESICARNERTVRNLITTIVIIIILLFASNAIWVYEWTRYDYSSESSNVDVDAKDGVATYIGNDGDIYGKDNCEKANP